MEPIEVVERLGRWSAGRGPLYVLLAGRLRTLIDDGDLRPGTRLPPDRALARALAVGRTTVVAAYDELSTDGRITRRQGSGTYVAGSPTPYGEVREGTGSPTFLHLLEPRRGIIMMACAAPTRPPPELIDAYQSALAHLAAIHDDIGYHPIGHPVLREAVAARFTDRGVPTDPTQVLITAGGQQALSLLARALVRPGDRVLVEVPTYSGALEAFREEGATLRGVSVGMPHLDKNLAEHRAAVAYVIPSFHNPTGAVLSALHRQRLVRAAAGTPVTLIEDEVLADLAFPGEDVPPPLASYDDRVVTIGSLSKVMWGGLRVGWVRAPGSLVARLARLRAVHDLGGNVPAQIAAAGMLDDLQSTAQRSAPTRQRAHDQLIQALARELPTWRIRPVPGGQTLWVRLPRGDGASFSQVAMRHGVAILPGTGLDATGGSDQYVRLHFILPPDQLDEAAHRLAAAWQDYHPAHDRTQAVPSLAV